MANRDVTPHTVDDLMSALGAARDRARVQAHLFSLDARRRWETFEGAVLDLESKLEHEGEKLAASVHFHELVQAARELVGELDGTLELATPVQKLMQQAPGVCLPTDSLNRAAEIMWDLDCGAVPVVGANGEVLGVVTDRDVCMAAYTRGQTLSTMSVESAMSTLVHACSPSDTVAEALRLMGQEQIRRVPVTEDGRLVGFITLADIAREIGRHTGNRIPACLTLADTLASICSARADGTKTT